MILIFVILQKHIVIIFHCYPYISLYNLNCDKWYYIVLIFTKDIIMKPLAAFDTKIKWIWHSSFFEIFPIYFKSNWKNPLAEVGGFNIKFEKLKKM